MFTVVADILGVLLPTKCFLSVMELSASAVVKV